MIYDKINVFPIYNKKMDALRQKWELYSKKNGRRCALLC